MNKACFITIFFLINVVVHDSKSQDLPVYNHYYNNAYLYNPAETGADGFTTITINHRQQWLAIEGAPQISTLSFETPFDNKYWALGIMARNFERGLLTTTDFLVSYAYAVYVSKTVKLNFGLSAGIKNNSIDIAEIDTPDDPFLNDYLNNNMQLIGQFGLKLHTKGGFNLGVSLPQLTQTGYVNNASFNNYTFSPFDEIVTMVYYKRKIDGKFVTKKVNGIRGRVKLEDVDAPLQFYAIYKYSKYADNRIELLTKLNLGEYAWVGGAFRFNYGFAAILGLNVQNFSFSYAYEPAAKQASQIVQGSHEVQLNMTIGRKKKIERKVPILNTVHHKEGYKPRYDEHSNKAVAQESSSAKHQHYVVLKVYKDFKSADLFKMKVQKETEIETEIYLNRNNNKFYVYIFKTDKIREAKKELKAVLELTKYKRTQIISIEK